MGARGSGKNNCSSVRNNGRRELAPKWDLGRLGGKGEVKVWRNGEAHNFFFPNVKEEK